MVLNPSRVPPALRLSASGAEESAPVEPAVLVEAAVFGGDERLPHELRDRAERNVDAAHGLQASHDAVVPVEDAAALIGLESLDLARRRAAVEAAGPQPDVGEVNR